MKKKTTDDVQSLWLGTTPKTKYPSLRGDVSVDVVIIGGGIAGLATGVLLKDAGLSVAVIEANRIVEAVTGNTTAKITSLHDLMYEYLISKFGQEKAQLYADANQAGIQKIAELVKKHTIDADFLRKSAFTFTEKDDEVEQIEKEVAAAKKLHLPASFITKTTLPFPIKAAIQFTNQAQFHPRKYVLALAKTIPDKSNFLFEETRAIRIEEGKKPKVKTEKGTITATYVIIATHAPFWDKAFYFARMEQRRSYVIAFQSKDIIPDGMFINLEQHSIRTQYVKGTELILVGGEDHKAGQETNTRERYIKLEAYARDHFSVAKIHYRWSTQDNMTLDRIPYIGRHQPFSNNIFVATGFNGWGMTHSHVAGMLFLDMIRAKKNPWESVFDPNRVHLASLPKLFTIGVNATTEILKGKLKKSPQFSGRDIKKDEGKVVEIDKKKVAIYKDPTGKIHAVSAVCTHLGCIVAWNNAQKTWDCPCHGSRFTYKGKVIQGPANKDLPSIPMTSSTPCGDACDCQKNE